MEFVRTSKASFGPAALLRAPIRAVPTLALGGAIGAAPAYVPKVDAFGMLATGIDAFVTAAGPNLFWLIPMAVLLVVVTFPMPRRGPNSSSRDAWRGFKHAPRRAVLTRASGRCEAAAFVAWGRCSSPAAEVDHVFPWSRGGPTVVSNGQALCAAHNRSKGAMNPPWWYVLSLERRRRGYFPEGLDVRVFAVMGADDIAARAAVPAARSRVRSRR